MLKDAGDIGIPQALSFLWDNLKISLEQGGLKRSEIDDHLVWSLYFSTSRANVKDIYLDLISKKKQVE